MHIMHTELMVGSDCSGCGLIAGPVGGRARGARSGRSLLLEKERKHAVITADTHGSILLGVVRPNQYQFIS